jgi:MoaA/NifB/PqqE/SkfB family radical SAM enzyme
VRSTELVQHLGGNVLAQAIVDAFASRPRFPLYDIGGEAESSVESSGSEKRLHVAFKLGDAFDVAGRVFPKRKVIDRIRRLMNEGRDLPGLTGLVGVVIGGERQRAKLYFARGDQVKDATMRALAETLATEFELPSPALPDLGRCDVVAVENEPKGAVSLKVYLTFDDAKAAEALVTDASDRVRLDTLHGAGREQKGRCPVMVTLRDGRAVAVQVHIRPEALGDIPFAPKCPPGARPTYVGFQLGTDGARVTTYFLVPGHPLDPTPPAADAPSVKPHDEPKAVDISIGEHCNNNCKFCINPTEKWSPLASGTAIRRVISEFAANGYKRLGFLGGEPTLHEELPEIVEHAYSEGFDEVMLVTNGRRFADPEFAKRIQQAGVRRALFMFVSHHADVHDRVTRKQGSHAEALAGLVEAQRAGVEACVNIPINSENAPHLADTGEFFADRGVRSLAYLYLAAYGNVLSNPEMMADYELTARSLVDVCDRLGSRVSLNIDNFPFCFLPGREQYIVGEMANPWREIAYPTGGVTDVSAFFRFRKRRLPQCDGCKWDRVCGGIQDRPGPQPVGHLPVVA